MSLTPGDLVIVFPGSDEASSLGIVVQCGLDRDDESNTRVTWCRRARVLSPGGLNVYAFCEMDLVRATAW